MRHALQHPEKPSFDVAARAAYPALSRAALVLLDNRADAEDAVQDTLLRACMAYDSFRGGSSPTTWMYAILTRVAADFRRRPSQSRERGAAGPLVTARTPGPDALAELDDESHALYERVRALPRRQREIVTLFYLEDLSYNEVAQALGVSVGTVKSVLCRARMALREAFGSSEAERKVDCELS